jgi:peptidoglycan hydrolase-like protein with peptidoglycan-binding domain
VRYAPVVTTAYVPAVAVTSVRSSIVVSAQEQLASMGYYGGAIDGAFGPRTSSAVVRFQRDYGLPVTGRLDRPTRASLGI